MPANNRFNTRKLPRGQFSDHSDAGWADARQGLPYRREYDGWPRASQINYEKGRLRFVGAATFLYKGAPPVRQTLVLANRLAAARLELVPPVFQA